MAIINATGSGAGAGGGVGGVLGADGHLGDAAGRRLERDRVERDGLVPVREVAEDADGRDAAQHLDHLALRRRRPLEQRVFRVLDPARGLVQGDGVRRRRAVERRRVPHRERERDALVDVAVGALDLDEVVGHGGHRQVARERAERELEAALVGRALVPRIRGRRLEHPAARVRLEARGAVLGDELVRRDDEAVQRGPEGRRVVRRGRVPRAVADDGPGLVRRVEGRRDEVQGRRHERHRRLAARGGPVAHGVAERRPLARGELGVVRRPRVVEPVVAARHGGAGLGGAALFGVVAELGEDLAQLAQNAGRGQRRHVGAQHVAVRVVAAQRDDGVGPGVDDLRDVLRDGRGGERRPGEGDGAEEPPSHRAAALWPLMDTQKKRCSTVEGEEVRTLNLGQP
mmetsp:Transcript_33088/g.112337  ORF Transcript_33088/g.112337 Transcript_33088/m.112337 type:complete len:400 (-) Transcript_33088:52-1251(-)